VSTIATVVQGTTQGPGSTTPPSDDLPYIVFAINHNCHTSYVHLVFATVLIDLCVDMEADPSTQRCDLLLRSSIDLNPDSQNFQEIRRALTCGMVSDMFASQGR